MPHPCARYFNELIRKNMAIFFLYLNPMEFAASCIQVGAMILHLAPFNWGLLRPWHVPTTKPRICNLHLQPAVFMRIAPCIPRSSASLDTYKHLGVLVPVTLFWFFKNSSSPTPGTSPFLQGTLCEMGRLAPVICMPDWNEQNLDFFLSFLSPPPPSPSPSPSLSLSVCHNKQKRIWAVFILL